MYLGLFGQHAGTLSNLTMKADIETIGSYPASVVGSLVGFMSAGSVTNCHYNGSIQVNRTAVQTSFVGGLVGATNVSLDQCSFTGSISTTNVGLVGGLCGDFMGTGTTAHRSTIDCTFNTTGGVTYIGIVTGRGDVVVCSTITHATYYKGGVNTTIQPTGSGTIRVCDQGH